MRGHVRKRWATWTAYWDVGDQPRLRCEACGWTRWGAEARRRCARCNGPVAVERMRRQRSKGGFATRRDAEDHLAAQLAAVSSGAHVLPADVSLGEYLTSWLEVQRSQLEPVTWVNYRRQLARYILPRLGDLPLQGIRVQVLNAAYADLKERGGVDGRTLSASTVRRVHAILHKALNDAARQDLVAYNVASKATLPKRDRSTFDPRTERFRTWTAEQLLTFLAAVEGHRLEAAFVVAANTGMRRGEVLGLLWEDVDLDGGALYVRHALGEAAGELYLKAPKTNRPRTIAVDERTVDALRARRRAQAEHRLAWPGEWRDEHGLVFTDEAGGMVRPMKLTDDFRKVVSELDLPRIRLHDLRHTHATLMLQAGVAAKIVADRLGHADIAMTLNTYSHVLPAMDRAALRAWVDHVYGGEAGGG